MIHLLVSIFNIVALTVCSEGAGGNKILEYLISDVQYFRSVNDDVSASFLLHPLDLECLYDTRFSWISQELLLNNTPAHV